MQEFWNERYGHTEYAYGTEPNAFLKAFLATRPPGRLLLPAEGEGRNAVYAATQGWDVTAFDFSEAARAKALALAEQRGVTLRYERMPLEDIHLPETDYDVVALIYVHQSESVRASMHRLLSAAVKPGGFLVLEAFSPRQLGKASGGPKEATKLYDPAMLRQDFASLHIVSLTEEETVLQEGAFHAGAASVIRLIAQKPMEASRENGNTAQQSEQETNP